MEIRQIYMANIFRVKEGRRGEGVEKRVVLKCGWVTLLVTEETVYYTFLNSTVTPSLQVYVCSKCKEKKTCQERVERVKTKHRKKRERERDSVVMKRR